LGGLEPLPDAFANLGDRAVVVIVVPKHETNWNAIQALSKVIQVLLNVFCCRNISGDHHRIRLMGSDFSAKCFNLTLGKSPLARNIGLTNLQRKKLREVIKVDIGCPAELMSHFTFFSPSQHS
jgi:hypothetical protein